MEIKERIKQARKLASLSQEQFAKKLGISFMTVRRWESGEISPRLSELKEISMSLDVPMEYLTGIVDTYNITPEKKALEIIDSARAKGFKNLTLGETEDMLIYYDGEQSVRLKNTLENRAIFKKTIYEMLENIGHNSEKEEQSNKTNPNIDITQKDIGRDATVNFGTIAVSPAI